MITVYFFQGLAAFVIGIIALLAYRYEAPTTFQRHFKWLGFFGLVSSAGLWGMMGQEVYVGSAEHLIPSLIVGIGVPAAGLVLLRFGLGLAFRDVQMPAWWSNAALIGVVSGAFLVAYILVAMLRVQPDMVSSVVMWSHMALFIPGILLAVVGLFRAYRSHHNALDETHTPLLIYLGIALVMYGCATVCIHVPALEDLAGAAQLQFVRLLTLMILTACVAYTLSLLENKRRQQTSQLQRERLQARQMAATIHTKTLQQAGVWLDNLIKLSSHIANMDAIDDVLLDVVKRARVMLDAEFAGLALLEQEGELFMKVQADEAGMHSVRKPVRSAVLSHAIENGKPLRAPEDTEDLCLCWYDAQHPDQQGIVAAVVPLKLEEHVIGVIWVARHTPSFSCTDLIGLGHLGDQAVIALEHASMASRLQSLAVVEERSRIAREMHDSLAQILAYLGVELQTLQGLVKQGQYDAVLEQLKNARSSVKSAQADVRESILCLRTTLAGDTNLVDALAEYLDEFAVQTGITTEFKNQCCKTVLPLSPLAETQLIRILQEALNNVRKHAKASRVSLQLQTEADALYVNVVDDGIGFEQKSIGEKHFGLATMCERAEEVNGTLSVESLPENGTSVRLVLPLM